MKEQGRIPIEFHTDITETDIDYYIMVENRIKELAEGHSDITGAAATLKQPAEGRQTPHIFEATVVTYIRPNNLSATEKDNNPELALKGALDAIERQVRQQRNRLKEDQGSLDDLWLGNLEADNQ